MLEIAVSLSIPKKPVFGVFFSKTDISATVENTELELKNGYRLTLALCIAFTIGYCFISE